MEDEPQKRFQKIMDRLYHYPKSSAGAAGAVRKVKTGVGGGNLSSRKFMECRRRGSGVGDGVSDLLQTCRPWDRGDFLRRLSTFRATTWFGKSKAVNPVNCARRGWINVDMDTIACEACGSRLLFSTPSSWSFNQVEKAAAVFSLKLDNGHKLLCPWTENICDESFALFPPTPDPELDEGYRKRTSDLLKLSALPVISSSVIDYMGSPHLELLLKEISSIESTLDKCIKLNDNSRHLPTDFISDGASTSLYFQAQKIISLCGWELRLLSYYVDCDNKPDQSNEKAKSGVAIYSSHMGTEGEENNRETLRYQYGPASAVLDCKFCGACVGLWAFKSIERPLELFSLSNFPDVVDQNESEHVNDGLVTHDIHTLGSGAKNTNSIESESSSILNLSIAGGLPPAKQNFKPRISLPVISRYLRAELSTMHDVKDHSSSISLEKNSAIEQAHNSTGALKRKRNDNEFSDLDNDETGDTCCELRNDHGRAIHEVGQEKLVGSEMHNNDSVRMSDSCPTSDPVAITSDISSCSEAVALLNGVDDRQAKKDKGLDSQHFTYPNTSNNDSNGSPREVIPPITYQQATSRISDTHVQMQWNNTGEFDPIGQHRPFCPWVVSGNGNGFPGWKLTLSAVVRGRDSSPALLKEKPLRSDNEVDDPIVSVRRLFATPLSKRSKG